MSKVMDGDVSRWLFPPGPSTHITCGFIVLNDRSIIGTGIEPAGAIFY